MTERYGSTRKHKKHKASHKQPPPNSSDSSGGQYGVPGSTTPVTSTASAASTSNGISSGETAADATAASTPSRQQPIRMVLKLAQSGAYSPAHAAAEDGQQPVPASSSQQQSQSLGDGLADVYSNGTLKRSKKKKKKHHHHHHHHHRHGSAAATSAVTADTSSAINFFDSGSNLSESFSGSGGLNPNATLNTLTRSTEDFEDEDEDDEDEDLSNGHGSRGHSNQNLHHNKAPNRHILNLIDSELMTLGASSPHDSLASVDLMDVDSSNLDISCLQTAGDSPPPTGAGEDGSDVNNSVQNGSAHRSSIRKAAKTRQRTSAANNIVKTSSSANASLYRRLLQAGEVRCDARNVLAIARTVGHRPVTKKAKAFAKFATEILSRLREKDPRRFFSWPTTDLMAPGYSRVVSQPMDFSTMEKKVQFCLYRSIYEMKLDVRILCENALKYYRSSGAQYKDAARLWSYAKREVFTRDTFADILKQCPPLTMDDLGLEQLIGEEPKKKKTKSQPVLNGFTNLSQLIGGGSGSNELDSRTLGLEDDEDDDEDEATKDEEAPWTKEEILREAAKCLGAAATDADDLDSKWALTRPEAAARLARQRPDGTTSLPFVVPQTTEVDIESPSTLGAFVGRLPDGTRALTIPKEPEMERVRLVQLVPEVLANPYSSHLPMFDAGGGQGMLNLEDTNLVLSHFGNCEAVYADAIQRVAEDADYMTSFVDSMLDIVSGGKYSKEKQQNQDTTTDEPDEPMDVTPTSEKDVELVSAVVQSQPEDPATDQPSSTTAATPTAADPVQCKLDETQSLLSQLQSLQYRRLCSGPEAKAPDEKEVKLADQVTSKLVEIIASTARPVDVVSVGAVRKAMGVMVPEEEDEEERPEADAEVTLLASTTNNSSSVSTTAVNHDSPGQPSHHLQVVIEDGDSCSADVLLIDDSTLATTTVVADQTAMTT